MKVFEIIATVFAYISVLALIICSIVSTFLEERFDKFFFRIVTFFCLPTYSVSFFFEGMSGNEQNMNFGISVFFLFLLIVIINHKKIKKNIERWKGKWK